MGNLRLRRGVTLEKYLVISGDWDQLQVRRKSNCNTGHFAAEYYSVDVSNIQIQRPCICYQQFPKVFKENSVTVPIPEACRIYRFLSSILYLIVDRSLIQIC